MKTVRFRSAVAGLAAMLLVLPAVLCVLGFCLPAQYGNTFLGAFGDKMDRLRSAEKDRIILVGGSSVPFSVRSDLIEAHFPGYDVVDLGLYADIGTPVMLDFLEEELRQGDIVIIAPEQNSQAMSDYFSAESVWQAVDGRFELLQNLSPERYEKLAAAFPVFAGKKCGYAVSGAPQPTDIYARESFNAWGDIQSELCRANIMAGGYDPNQPIGFGQELLGDEFVQILNDFAALAENAGAQVYYRFSPMNRDAVQDAENVDAFYEALRGVLDFPILGDPNRSILDSGWFYDTNFHLNSSGAVVFTKALIEDLKILWKDTSPTEVELPAMPEPERPVVIQGDDSCADCFTYSRTENGWRIDGLSEKGKSARELTVPTTWAGEPVTELAQDVFEGNTALRRLTIQPNIGILYDGMFRGCSNLRELVLTGDSPANHTVGTGLLEGADFRICVPAEALDRYRRHYSWQHYSQRLTTEDLQ